MKFLPSTHAYCLPLLLVFSVDIVPTGVSSEAGCPKRRASSVLFAVYSRTQVRLPDTCKALLRAQVLQRW
eukprot:6211140-Pleurochrysis_carterae.AAC.1